MVSYSRSVVWGPGYIGFTVATFLYGVEICQFAFYAQAFRSDKIATKLLVLVIAILDTVHFIALIASFYQRLVSCHLNTSLGCTYYISWAAMTCLLLSYVVTFAVQIFYAHRVWIISGYSRIITLVVVVSTTIQLTLGLLIFVEVCQTPTNTALYSSRYGPISAVLTAACDCIITISVMYYLRPASIRRESYVKQLLIVFVQMGLFTLINALTMAILYYIQDAVLGQYLTSAPGTVMGKSYVNSMLAVLNARKPIRDRQQKAQAMEVVDLPTLPTIR